MNFCKANVLWEYQGPQLPHMNVMGIATFTEISIHHRHLIKYLTGMRVSREGNICKIVAEVWAELPSCKIANSFFLLKGPQRKL